jgi:hypothetical protein
MYEWARKREKNGERCKNLADLFYFLKKFYKKKFKKKKEGIYSLKITCFLNIIVKMD